METQLGWGSVCYAHMSTQKSSPSYHVYIYKEGGHLKSSAQQEREGSQGWLASQPSKVQVQ